jgi:hypothetical protein
MKLVLQTFPMSLNVPPGRKLVFLPVIAVAFLALFPQLLLMVGGGKWNGSYFVSNYDETAYSAYVNSLIRGEPRKNDPFLGLSDSPQTPQPETLYSIQFMPAYAIALPARLLGLNVSTAFIILAVLIALFSTLAIYKLLLTVTGDAPVSIVGPVVILGLGTAVAYQGELRNLIEGRVLADFFPYLRRYQPGFAFPVFFVFCLFVWKAIRSGSVRGVIGLSAAAGIIFGVLVYSYFYLWTAAVAWLACFAVFSIVLRAASVRRVLTTYGVVSGVGLIALCPYFYLLSQRSANLDRVQLLTLTRMPDLASPSMWIGVIVAAAGAYLMWGRSDEAYGRLPLILTFALTPVILFNQQIITGRSLQPVHYELFIANYLVLTAAVLLLSASRSTGIESESKPLRFERGLIYLGIAAFAWGFFEAYGSTSRNFTPAVIRDASVLPISAAASERDNPPVILATNFVTADFIPSVGTARPLWNPHISSAGGVGIDENRRLFHLYLYFSGFTSRDLEAALKANSFEVTAAVFGSERALPSLAGRSKTITAEEIRAEVSKFADLTKNLDERSAYTPMIDHIIVPAAAEPDFANLDRWYARDEGQTFGLFKLYRLTPKAAPR